MDVSKNSGTPKSSILIGFSIINHPSWGTPILETPIWLSDLGSQSLCRYVGFKKRIFIAKIPAAMEVILKSTGYSIPKDPITFSDDDWVYNHLRNA